MTPNELLQEVSGDSEELDLYEPVRFRRRTRSNPQCSFNEFLHALKTNETIERIHCHTVFIESISADEWIRLIQVMRSLKRLEALCFHCSSRVPMMALAEAVRNPSLRNLCFGHDITLLGDPDTGREALALSLRESTLEDFAWLGDFSEQHIHSLTPLLYGLAASPSIQKVKLGYDSTTTHALRYLIRSDSLKELQLVASGEHWLAVADEMQQGNSHIQSLVLSAHFGSDECDKAAAALANAIRVNGSLENLVLRMCNGYTDAAVAELAAAIQMNTHLCQVDLSTNLCSSTEKSYMGFKAFGALRKMLIVRTNLDLTLPDPCLDENPTSATLEQHGLMRIEMGMNAVGRGQLLGHTDRAIWVDALGEVNAKMGTGSELDDVQVDCLYELLLLNPSVCQSVGPIAVVPDYPKG